MYKYFYIFLLVLTAALPAFADVITDGSNDSDDSTVYLYTGDSSVKDPKALDSSKFTPMPDRFSLGYTREPHWFRISVTSESDKPILRYILLEDGFMFDRVDFFQFSSGKLIKTTRDGVYVPADKKEVFYHGAVSVLKNEGKGRTDIYVRTETKTPCVINLQIRTDSEFQHN